LFDNLSEKLGGILDRLTGRGSLSEADVDAAMREVRRALLEADVSLDVVRSFIDRVREQAVGATVVKSVTPGQMVVKIVHDELVATLGDDGQLCVPAQNPRTIFQTLLRPRAHRAVGRWPPVSRAGRRVEKNVFPRSAGVKPLQARKVKEGDPGQS